MGLTRNQITTTGGLRVIPGLSINAFSPADTAMSVLPGATSWDQGLVGPFLDAAAAGLEEHTPVAAICGTTLGLANRGLLSQRQHTSNDLAFLAQSQ